MAKAGSATAGPRSGSHWRRAPIRTPSCSCTTRRYRWSPRHWTSWGCSTRTRCSRRSPAIRACARVLGSRAPGPRHLCERERAVHVYAGDRDAVPPAATVVPDRRSAAGLSRHRSGRGRFDRVRGRVARGLPRRLSAGLLTGFRTCPENRARHGRRARSPHGRVYGVFRSMSGTRSSRAARFVLPQERREQRVRTRRRQQAQHDRRDDVTGRRERLPTLDQQQGFERERGERREAARAPRRSAARAGPGARAAGSPARTSRRARRRAGSPRRSRRAFPTENSCPRRG